MDQSHGDGLLLLPLLLLAVAVISVPVARLLRLSAIVAYLAAGVVIGPFGLALVRAPDTIIAVSELGVVLLLFLIGLELEFSRLLALRRAIFGLGVAQLALTAAVLAGLAFALGLTGWRGAVIGGLALAMSATAIALKILEERGHLQQLYGQRAFAILLFQDMSVVPILALLPLLAPDAGNVADAHVTDWTATLIAVGRIGACIAAVVIAGRYLLNPFLALLAGTGAREVMTAAALLVVLGAAALMQFAGMSMALGAFLAGVMLAGSNYRHELEADIEPFRGLLLALFFMGVGMSIDMQVVAANIMLIVAAAIVITLLKAGIVAVLFRATCANPGDALRAGSVLTLGGEERTLRPAPRVGRQLDGALVKCRPRRQAAARPRSPGRAVQLGGDILVEAGCRLRAVPGATIRIDVGIGGLRESAVHAPALLRRASTVDRRTHERMNEAHLRAENNQSRGCRRRGRVRADAEPGGRPPHQHGIACRLSRRDEEQEPRRRRERRQPLPEALLDPPRHRRGAGQREPARELGRRPAAWQLKQRQRVAARLGHDPITYPLIERPGEHCRQQRLRSIVV